MDYISVYNDNWHNIGGENILNKRYLLYGLGITNKAIKNYFDKEEIEYLIYCDDTTNDTQLAKIILNKIDIIVKSPGIKFDTAFLRVAEALNKKIVSDIELYYQFFKPTDMVLVTGSVGKTTIATLISRMLSIKEEFKDKLVGNIGLPTFTLASKKSSCLVVEASSFMLHYTYKTKPHVMVIPNIIKHHIDYHKTYNSYIKDKLKIIRNMNHYDYVVYNKEDVILDEIISKMSNVNKISYSLNEKNANCYFDNNYIMYNNEKLIDINEVKKSELHNIEDYMASICVAKIYDIKKNHINEVIEHFEGLKYRFEMVYHTNDLIIINDSKSTTPYASLAGAKSIKNNYNSYYKVLIVGGIMKENYYCLAKQCDFIDEVYTYGTSKNRLAEVFSNNLVKVFDTLEEVIEKLPLKKPLLILFSPSCVSYDQYSSYIERGSEFNKLIKRHYNL